MIDDGYNRFAELQAGNGFIRLEYRPALRRERLAVFNRIDIFGSEWTARAVLLDELARRVFRVCCPGSGTRHDDIHLDWIVGDRTLFPAAIQCVMGQRPFIDEEADVRNLREGVRFYLQHPALAHLSCGTCQKWLMDPITGKISERPKGKKLLRQPEDVLLCETHEGCPKGTPQDPKGLSAKNAQALRYYLECRAIGQFPDDAIVRRNARIISEVYEQHQKGEERVQRLTR